MDSPKQPNYIAENVHVPHRRHAAACRHSAALNPNKKAMSEAGKIAKPGHGRMRMVYCYKMRAKADISDFPHAVGYSRHYLTTCCKTQALVLSCLLETEQAGCGAHCMWLNASWRLSLSRPPVKWLGLMLWTSHRKDGQSRVSHSTYQHEARYRHMYTSTYSPLASLATRMSCS